MILSMLQKTGKENTKNLRSFSVNTKFEQAFKKLKTKKWGHLFVQIAIRTYFIAMGTLNQL